MYKNISEFIKHIYQIYFELAAAISAIMIILIAVVMDKFLYLQACPMCILTRYVFGLIALSATFINLITIFTSVGLGSSLIQKTELLFALGKAYEDIKEFKKSYFHLFDSSYYWWIFFFYKFWFKIY